jgi:DNA-binding PadR family transcriptional regulator
MSNLSPELAVLGFLIAGPCHGYDLHQRFTTELGHVWHLSQSQTYAILNRLEAHGDISSRTIEQDKLPARQKLRITSQGRRHFQEWLEGSVGTNARSVRLEFLTRLYFIQQHAPGKVPSIYQAQYNEVLVSVERLETLLAHLPPEQIYNRLSLDLRLRQMKLIREWLEEIRSQIHIEAPL